MLSVHGRSQDFFRGGGGKHFSKKFQKIFKNFQKNYKKFVKKMAKNALF